MAAAGSAAAAAAPTMAVAAAAADSAYTPPLCPIPLLTLLIRFLKILNVYMYIIIIII